METTLFIPLLQLSVDTAMNVADSVSNALGAVACKQKLVSMLDMLLLPLILLCLFSAMKNLVAVGEEKIDAIDFFAELAVDLLSIFSSFIIGRYFLESNPSSILLSAVKVVGFMAMCVIVLCYIRRKIMGMRGTSQYTGKGVAWWIAGEYALDIISLILIVVIL